MIWFTHPFLKILGATCDAQTFPTWTSIAVRMLLFFLIEDFYFYWVHRALHSEYLYKRLHKIHHEYAAPFGMVSKKINKKLLFTFVSSNKLRLLNMLIPLNPSF